MKIAIDVPEDIACQLQAKWGNLSLRTLEALTLEAYRLGAITEAQVQQMLNLSSRWDVEQVLKQAQAYLNYTEIDLEGDIHAIRYLRQQ